MGSTVNLNITLTPEIYQQVQLAVDAGEYGSSSEIVEDALRDWTRKRTIEEPSSERLRLLWQEAERNTSPGYPMEEFMEKLEAEYRARVDSADHAR